MPLTIADFETLEHCKMLNISGLGWSAPLVSANFGGGYGAGVLANQDYGLHRWTIKSEFLPDHTRTITYTADAVEYTDYYFSYVLKFFQRHILKGNKPFLIVDSRVDKTYLVALDTAEFDFGRLTAKFYSSEGIRVVERRHADLTFDTDGSISTVSEALTYGSVAVEYGAVAVNY